MRRKKLKATRHHEGQYLLRTNLTGEDPAELRRNHINLVRIEECFRTLRATSDCVTRRRPPTRVPAVCWSGWARPRCSM